MKRLFYPALFQAEEDGYSISVPDLDGCFTEGDTLETAYENTIDAIGLCLEELQANNQEFPPASAPNQIAPGPNEYVVLIEFDPLEYKKRNDNKSVKKTLTIPSWLNKMAEEQHVNFSGVLQSALKKHLDID